MQHLPRARLAGLLSAAFAAFAASAVQGQSRPAEGRWFRGNLHTHTWFSDGVAPPELMIAWYKEHGYQFLALSDHNRVDDREKWVSPTKAPPEIIAAIKETYRGEERRQGDQIEYRVRPLNELRPRFEEPGRFVLIPAEEISDQAEGRPVHLNGINLKETIAPQGGKTVVDALRGNILAVAAQARQANTPMLTIINHPNFGWALTAADILDVKEARHFEVYNGHGGVANYGDDTHASTERMWDIILTKRLEEPGSPLLYGVATDDAHAYPATAKGSPPGRGWVMVRARSLTPDAIVTAMQRGRFYASTGIELARVRFDDGVLSIDVQAKPGVTYRTQFIGTLAGYDRAVTPRTDAKGNRVTARYSDDLGKILSEQTGPRAEYRLTGREIYVRAKVISDVKHPNPHKEGDVEVAWIQPVRPTRR